MDYQQATLNVVVFVSGSIFTVFLLGIKDGFLEDFIFSLLLVLIMWELYIINYHCLLREETKSAQEVF